MDRREIKLAILQFTVNFLGCSLLALVYLNYQLIKDYITPLLWGVLFSIPLHSYKKKLQNANISLLYFNPVKTLISAPVYNLLISFFGSKTPIAQQESESYVSTLVLICFRYLIFLQLRTLPLGSLLQIVVAIGLILIPVSIQKTSISKRSTSLEPTKNNASTSICLILGFLVSFSLIASFLTVKVIQEVCCY